MYLIPKNGLTHRVSPYANHTMKGYQRGGGLRNKTSPFMLSIDKHAIDSEYKTKRDFSCRAGR